MRWMGEVWDLFCTQDGCQPARWMEFAILFFFKREFVVSTEMFVHIRIIYH